MQIRLDDLRGPEIRALLEEHLAHMSSQSPPESMHALDLDALRAPEIRFYTAWSGADLLGCGAFKRLGNEHAEIKSMRTSAGHLRRGVATGVLTHLMEQARLQGITRLSLETGPMVGFDAARRLYERFGFEYCEPFGDYVLDDFSVFMTRTI